MQYATIPAVHTQERVFPVFTFLELPLDVQEEILERDKFHPPYDLFGMLLHDDFDLDISEHFVPKLKEYGINIDTKDVPTYGGKVRQKPAVWWETEPCRVWFEGSVDAEQFLKSVDTARYNDIDALLAVDLHIRLETEHGKQSVDIELYRYQSEEEINNAEKDIETLEGDILETYRNLTQEMEESLRSQYEYLGSDSWYREERTEGNQSDILYSIDGTEFNR